MDVPEQPTISPAGDIPELIAALRERPLAEILAKLKLEKHAAEVLAKRLVPAAEAYRLFDYVQSIRCLIYWLNSHGRKRPSGCEEFPLFRPLAESLVSRGLLDSNAISLFSNKSSSV